MDKVIKEWLNISLYDLDTARALLKTKRYLYVAFMCQQSIEKILKAIYSQKKGSLPPRSHNLLYLTDVLNLDLGEYRTILSELNQFYLESRYPDERMQLARALTRQKAENILSMTKEAWKCLRQILI